VADGVSFAEVDNGSAGHDFIGAAGHTRATAVWQARNSA